MNRYLIVVEKADRNWGAFAPDLPGCVALGDTVEETMELMREAIDMQLEGMVEDGDAIPEATTLADYIDVEIPTKAKSAPTRSRARKKVPARR